MSFYIGSLPYNFNQDITDGAENAIDGRRDTYTTETSITMPLGREPMTATAVPFNAMFLACQDVNTYSLTNMTSTTLASSCSTPQVNISGGAATTGQRQYVLATFANQSDSSVTLAVTGSGARVYEVMIFNSVWSYHPITDFNDARLEISMGKEARGSVMYEALDYTESETPAANGGKFFGSVMFQCANTTWYKRVYDLHNFLTSNTMFTIGVAQDAYRDRVFQARLSEPLNFKAMSRTIDVGEQISFSFRER